MAVRTKNAYFGRIPVMNCSVVVPVYQGERMLPSLVVALGDVLPQIAERYEVILVNDGSPDDSWNCILELSQGRPWLTGINLMRNYGQHNATLCGVRMARYEITITMDQDSQHPPAQIPLLLGKLGEGFDVIYGAPRRLPQSFWRNQITRFTKLLLSWIMGIPSVRNISAFRAFRTQLREAFTKFQSPTLTLDVLLSWGTNRFGSVEVDIEPSDGNSNYNFATLFKQTVLILTGYSTAPLRLASWVGFIMTLFGLGIFVYVITVYFTQGSMPGFPFLASIISLFSGAQLFTLGIFGEYLARMFDRSMDRPPYVIQDEVGGENN